MGTQSLPIQSLVTEWQPVLHKNNTLSYIVEVSFTTAHLN